MAVRVFVFKVIDVVAIPVGLVVEPYTVEPDASVISTLEVEDAYERLMTMAVMTSVPPSVCNVNESVVVAPVPGPTVNDVGSVPDVMVVVTFGVTGDPVGVSPVE